MTETTRETIGQRLAAARQAISPYIQKDKKVRGSGPEYNAVTHDWVTAFCRKAFVDAGILVYPAEVDCHCAKETYGKQDTKAFLTTATFVIRFASTDDVNDYVDVKVPAQAFDSSDKGAGKIISYAQKYAILKMMMLESGDDEEGRLAESPAARRISEAQQTQLLEGLESIDARLESLSKSFATWHPDEPFEGVHQFTVSEFNVLMSRIQNARAKRKQENATAHA